jgi:hypothetical protein
MNGECLFIHRPLEATKQKCDKVLVEFAKEADESKAIRDYGLACINIKQEMI